MFFSCFSLCTAYSAVPCRSGLANLALLAGLLAFSSTVFADQSTLTLTAAQRLAVTRSQQLKAQDFAVAAAREMAIAARQLPDPQLKFGIDNLPVNGADRFSLTNDFMTQRRIGVMQEMTRPDKRQLRGDRLEREAEKNLAEKDRITASIERSVALAWLERYYAETMFTVMSGQQEQARLESDAAESAYRAGRGGQADLYAARAAWVTFDDRASDMARRVRNAVTLLARWVGAAATLPLGEKPEIGMLRMNPATLETELAHHPEITALASQEAIAATEVSLARANRRADWSVEIAFQQRGTAYANMISVGVSLPWQWDPKKRQDKELSARLAYAEQASAERTEALRAHVAETRNMFSEWDNNRARLQRFERELAPLANQRTTATIAAYRGGKASLADVLAARRNEIEVRLQTLQLEADTARLWAQLNFLFPTAGATASSGAFGAFSNEGTP